jgi:hypothetical protein
MSEHERGAYAPPTADAPLSFDPRQPVRGARPIPFTLILSVLVLAGLVAAIFFFYQSGVRQAGDAPQVVGEPTPVIKTPPPAEAQPQDPAAGLQVYRSEAGGPMETVPAAPTFTKGPEQPQARTPAPVAAAPAPPVQAAPTPPPMIRPALPAAAPVQAPPAKVVAATPAPKAAAPAAKPPVQIAKATPEPAKPAPVKPAPAKVEPAKTETAKAAAKPAPGGAAAVQIGAVSSTALADKAWSDAVAVAPGLAAGKGKGVEKIEKNGGTLYRTAVTGFASRADAQAFCAKLQAAGKSCFVR